MVHSEGPEDVEFEDEVPTPVSVTTRTVVVVPLESVSVHLFT